MKYTGAEIIIKLLEREGIDIVAGIPGGANLPLYHALGKSSIRHVLARHEQGAGFIAHGIARSTGKPAVCFATSGPGATNLITAIADAKLDSVPIIAITGQVPSGLIGTDAFQEIDTYGMSLSICKHNYLVKSAEELLQIIPEAFSIAREGRPGPVLIDVPKDVQKQEIEVSSFSSPERSKNQPKIPQRTFEQLAKKINKAQRPLLFIGGGIILGNAAEPLAKLARKNNVPIISTLMGLGAFRSDDPLFLGMVGMHAQRSTNHCMNAADLIIACGVRFDDRATGKVTEFCPDARIIHIDIDPAEINKIKQAHYPVTGDCSAILTQLESLIHENERKGWIRQIQSIRKEYPSIQHEEDPYNPVAFIKTMAELLPSDTIVATDVGQHQMWVAQHYPFKRPRTLLTSGGLGTMGFGLPAAIGAALANPDKHVVCITGDGSILMNIQELATLADLELNITIIIMNNGYLGLVRQQQELFYEKQYFATQFHTNPDFSAIAGNFGISGYCLSDTENPREILSKTFSQKKPCLLDVPIHDAHNVFPMVPPGGANHEMIG